MTDRGQVKPPGAIRLGSLKWLWVLVCPFLALLAETRLNTAILERDIRMSTVNAELKRLQEAQDSYNVKIATLEKLERIEIAAPDLGLVPPQPNQIRTLYYDETDAFRQPPADESELSDSARHTLVAPSEDSPWSSKTPTRPRPMTPIARLRETIVAVCESCLGRSF